jgi:hypothetical protein
MCFEVDALPSGISNLPRDDSAALAPVAITVTVLRFVGAALSSSDKVYCVAVPVFA